MDSSDAIMKVTAEPRRLNFSLSFVKSITLSVAGAMEIAAMIRNALVACDPAQTVRDTFPNRVTTRTYFCLNGKLALNDKSAPFEVHVHAMAVRDR